MTGLGQALMGWTLAATLAAVTAALLLRSGRQRTAINEALHELRRPLQALALSGSSASGPAAVESSTRLAAAALERLEREVNGGGEPQPAEPVRGETMLRSAVGRWRARVALGGGSLELRWRAGEAVVLGDRVALEQAVDNLIVNAIEHGGPEIVVEGRRRAGRLLISVGDSGRGTRVRSRPGGRGAAVGRIAGGRHRGHGLAVVRRAAAAHRGRVGRQRGGEGSVAMLDLPLAAEPATGADSAA
jgi:signal transduction histidine kinase